MSNNMSNNIPNNIHSINSIGTNIGFPMPVNVGPVPPPNSTVPPSFFPVAPSSIVHASVASSQGEPKRKRVQVPAACAQCKRAHAACSNTRPCDRCVRINQAAACVNSFPLRPIATVPPKNSAAQVAQHYMDTEMSSVPPLSASVSASTPPTTLAPNVPFNENDISRFLFEEPTNDFNLSELPGHFECLETSCDSDSSCGMGPSPASTPSPQACLSPNHSGCFSPSSSTPAPSPPATPQQPAPAATTMPASIPTASVPPSSCIPPGSVPTPFMKSDAAISIPPRVIGPTAASIAATIASHTGTPANANSTADAHILIPPDQLSTQHQPNQHQHLTQQYQQQQHQQQQHQQQQHQQQQPQQQQPFQHNPQPHQTVNQPMYVSSTIAPPQTNLMEVMMSELIQQNKKMENMLISLNSEMKTLKQEVTHLKSADTASSALMVSKLERTNIPATAVWTVSDGLLVEHNQKFADILDLMEVPKGYSMQHFFGGPCSKAASARMNHHLENIKNAQPVTDYAVIERKRVTGEVMRLMIVVNVVPTGVPVFITTMYEL